HVVDKNVRNHDQQQEARDYDGIDDPRGSKQESHFADNLSFQKQEARAKEEKMPMNRTGVDFRSAQKDPTQENQNAGNQDDRQGQTWLALIKVGPIIGGESGFFSWSGWMGLNVLSQRGV